MKISVVMTCYNRRQQVLFTLKTIANTAHKDLEIIIVDDCSNDDNKITLDILHNSDIGEQLKLLDIKVIRIENKSWVNPCIGYNVGIKASTGDIIILQNGEVCHVGDCISFVAKHLEKNDWLTLNCYGLGSFVQNTELYNISKSIANNDREFINSAYKFITSKPSYNKIGGNSIYNKDVSGWLNNSDIFFTAYHYFGAIWRSSLMEKMGGGFCEEYKDGLCLDDIDFVKYLIHNNFKFKINKFTMNNVFVIHQYHEKTSCMATNPTALYKINKIIFDKRMAKINTNNHVDIKAGFNMPAPIIIS